METWNSEKYMNAINVTDFIKETERFIRMEFDSLDSTEQRKLVQLHEDLMIELNQQNHQQEFQSIYEG